VIAAVLSLVLAADPSATFETKARVAHLDAALRAIRESKPDVLDQAYAYLVAMERGSCASDNERLRSDCMITAARRFCKTGGKAEGSRCPLFMDVIASNVLAERELVPESQRYEMMNRAQDYRQEVVRYVRRMHGSLAVELALSTGSKAAASAAQIERYCRVTADKSSLSWQTCASALLWFIGRGL
jgi:hypothetical protein